MPAEIRDPGTCRRRQRARGHHPPGESLAGTTNFRVDAEALGEVTGTLTLSYEDDYGERYEKEIPLSTTIEKKAAAPTPPSGVDKDGDSRLPGWLAWAGGAVLLAAAAFFAIRWYKQAGRYPD